MIMAESEVQPGTAALVVAKDESEDQQLTTENLQLSKKEKDSHSDDSMHTDNEDHALENADSTVGDEETGPGEKKKKKRRKFDDIERPHICKYTNCGRPYATEHSLAQHVRIKHLDLNGGRSKNRRNISHRSSLPNTGTEQLPYAPGMPYTGSHAPASQQGHAPQPTARTMSHGRTPPSQFPGALTGAHSGPLHLGEQFAGSYPGPPNLGTPAHPLPQHPQSLPMLDGYSHPEGYAQPPEGYPPHPEGYPPYGHPGYGPPMHPNQPHGPGLIRPGLGVLGQREYLNGRGAGTVGGHPSYSQPLPRKMYNYPRGDPRSIVPPPVLGGPRAGPSDAEWTHHGEIALGAGTWPKGGDRYYEWSHPVADRLDGGRGERSQPAVGAGAGAGWSHGPNSATLERKRKPRGIALNEMKPTVRNGVVRTRSLSSSAGIGPYSDDRPFRQAHHNSQKYSQPGANLYDKTDMGSRSGSLPSMEAIVQNGALAGRHPAQRARHLLTGSPKFDRPRSKSMSVKQGQTPTSAQGSALSQAQLITWQLGLANQRLADGEMDMNESAFALGAQSEADIPSSLQLSDFNSHMSHNTHHGSEGNLSLGASGVMDFATHPASEGRSSVGSHGNGAGGVADLASTPLGDGGLPGSSSGPNSKRSTSGTLSRNVSGGTGSGSADKVNETVARVQNIMSHGQITDEQALALKDTLTALTNLKALQERQDSRGSGTSAGGGLVAGSSGSMSGSGEVTPGIVTEAKCSSNVGVLPSIGEYVTEVVDVLEEALAKFTFSMRPGGGKTAPGTGVMGANHITNLAMRSPMGTIMDGGSLSGSMLNSPILHRSAISSPQVSLEAPIGLPAPLNDGSSGVIDAPSLTSLNLADFDMNNLGNLDGLIPGAEYPNGCDNMRSSLSSQNLVGASPGETFSPMFGDMGAEHEDLDLNIMMDPFLSSDLYGPMGNVAELDLSTGPLPDSLRGSLGSDVGNIGNTPRTATMTDPAGLSGGGLDAGLGIGMDEDTHMNDAYSPIAGTDTTHMDASAKATQPPQYVEGTASGGATGSPHMSPRAAPGDKDRTGAHPFQPIEITTDGLVSPSPPPRSTPEAGSPNTGQALEGNMHLDDGKSVATPSNDLPVPHGRSGPGSSPLARQGQVFEKPTNSLAGIRGELMEGAVEGMNGLLDTFSGWSGNSWGSEEKKQ